MMTGKTISIALALAAAAAVPAAAQMAPPPPPAEANTNAAPYVMAAGMSDLYEISSSQIAVQKSPDPAVRKFAAMLIRHHQQTTAATLKAARQAGLNPAPPALDGGTSASVDELRNAPAADFDRLYIGQQIPAHQAALALHQSYAANGDQPALRASARAAVPIVKQHIAAATSLQSGKPTTGM